MANNDQKSPSRVWVETLTPIILALIGIVVPLTTVLLDRCNSNNGPATSQPVANNTQQGSSQPPAKSPAKVPDPKPVNISVRESENPKEELTEFSGKVTDITGTTGISGVEITYLDISTKSLPDGSFKIKIPKNTGNFILKVHRRGFKTPPPTEFNLKKDNGKARIKLSPD